MRTIELNVYKYSELSDEAKEKAKEWYLNDDTRAYIFQQDCELYLKEAFPSSELNVEFSLGYCQGDGLNIYGELCVNDLIERLAHEFTKKELAFFKWYHNKFGYEYIDMAQNPLRYSYCVCEHNDYMNEYQDTMEYWQYRGIPYALLDRVNDLCKDYMCDLCSQFEKDGYRFLYEISDEEMEDTCEANGYEFYENGKIA